MQEIGAGRRAPRPAERSRLREERRRLSTREAAAGLQNFRDASGPGRGYEAGGGRRMRSGVLFRSDNAAELGEAAAASIAIAHPARAFDLRSASERRRVPSIFSSLEGTHVTAFEDLTSFNEGELAGKLLTTLVGRQDVAGLMLLYYGQLPAVFARPIGRIAGDLLASDRAAVVHCRGGKDRTGFVTAVLHRAIGVSDEDARADYLASAGLFHPGPEEAAMLDGIHRRTGLRLDSASLAPMMTVAPAYLDAAFAEIDRTGGFDAYLATCGLGDDDRAELRDRLTTDEPARA